MSPTADIDEAYRICEAITRREAKNFSYGIRLLHPPERRALSAVYALARRIDDLGDDEGDPEDKLAALEGVRRELGGDLRASSDPVLAAIGDATARYELPLSAFDELVQGCEMDVRGVRYETIDDLVGYCRRVAGTIGRLSLAVFGSADRARAEPIADDLGVALQLTNILRDVLEDGRRGRVYLPSADLAQFGCQAGPDGIAGPPDALTALIAFECSRAHQWFDRGLALLPLLEARGRSCVGAMAGIYYRLLCRIERDPGAVTRGRVSVPSWEKAWVAATAMWPSAGLHPVVTAS